MPVQLLRLRAPLLLESEGTAVDTAAAKIKYLLTTFDRSLQEIPVHEHVGVGGIVLSQ